MLPDGVENLELFFEENENKKIVYSFFAKSYNDACRQRNEFMGWEPYQPMINPITNLPYEDLEKEFEE